MCEESEAGELVDVTQCIVCQRDAFVHRACAPRYWWCDRCHSTIGAILAVLTVVLAIIAFWPHHEPGELTISSACISILGGFVDLLDCLVVAAFRHPLWATAVISGLVGLLTA